MKKFMALFMCVLLMLCMSACGSQNAPTQPDESQIRNAETTSSETTDPETVETTDTASESESADDTEEPETTSSAVESSPSSGNTGRPAAQTNPPQTNPVGTTNPPQTNPPQTQKPTAPPSPETKPSIPVAPPVTQPSAPTTQPVRGKTLIVYFSWSSNTERMANTMKEQTGGDLLELIPVTAYPTDYTACTEVALEERDNNARPAIRNLPASLDEYDTILIGYPIWWHTAPMIIGTFLESYDLTGIDVYPFTQSASMDRTQFDNSMEFVRECAGGGTVHDGLFARYSDSNSITAYLRNNNLIK